MRSRFSTLWRHPDFLKLWTGQSISLLGSQVTLLALPLTAILTLKATAFQMGVLRALQYAPALLIGLFAGAYIDRLRRRPILMAADAGRALLLGSIPLVALAGALSMGYLYGVAFLVGTLTVIFEVAYLAFLPALVGRAHLMDANVKLGASESVAQLAGPGLGGLLVQALTAPLAIAADAITFVVSVFSLALIHAPEARPAATRERHIWREIGEGLRLALGHPILRATLIGAGITNFFAAILNSLFVLYATARLHLSPATIGAIFVLASVGGLAGAIATQWVTRHLGPGPTLLLAMLLIGVGTLVVPLAGGPAWLTVSLITAGLSVTAIGDSFWNINAVSLRQALVPDRLMGRVTASGRFVIWGAQPFGALLGGALGAIFDLRIALAVAACGFLFSFVALALSPLRTLRELPPQIENAPIAAAEERALTSH